MMGYDKEDVNDFISFLSEDYETLYKQAIENEQKIKKLQEQVETYKNMDETMKNTLIVAQSTAETMQKNAAEKAELIIKDAEVEAKKIIENAKRKAEEYTSVAAKTKNDMDIFRCKAISMLNAQIENLQKYDVNE